jgi:glycerophosphoryl diester phosphodiesterase
MFKFNRYLLHPRKTALAGIALLLVGCFGTVHATRPEVIAHRGASGYLPEHTLEAVALAYGMGADFIEQDLVLTKDGIPVVLHDIHIDTVTDVVQKFPDRKRDDGRYYAIDFTLAELKQLNAHERINHRTGQPSFPGRFPLNQSIFKIPTLEEELQFIAGLYKCSGNSVGFYPVV